MKAFLMEIDIQVDENKMEGMKRRSSVRSPVNSQSSAYAFREDTTQVGKISS